MTRTTERAPKDARNYDRPEDATAAALRMADETGEAWAVIRQWHWDGTRLEPGYVVVNWAWYRDERVIDGYWITTCEAVT